MLSELKVFVRVPVRVVPITSLNSWFRTQGMPSLHCVRCHATAASRHLLPQTTQLRLETNVCYNWQLGKMYVYVGIHMNICRMCAWLLGLGDVDELPGVRGACKLQDVGDGKVSSGRAVSTLSDEPSLQALNCRDVLKKNYKYEPFCSYRNILV